MGIAAIPQIGERAQTFEDILQSLLPGLLHGTVTHASGHIGDFLMLAVIAQRDDQTKNAAGPVIGKLAVQEFHDTCANLGFSAVRKISVRHHHSFFLCSQRALILCRWMRWADRVGGRCSISASSCFILRI